MRGALCFLATLLASCALPAAPSLEPPPLPVARPGGPPPKSVQPIAGGWYPVDAQTVVVLAGDRDIDVLAGRAKLAEARAVTKQAQDSVWPTLAPQLSFYRLDGLTQATRGEFVDVGKQNLTLGSGVTLSLDVVEARTRILAARLREGAARKASEAAGRAAQLEALERYAGLVEAQNEMAIAREVLAGAKAVADFQRARERTESGLRSDRLRAEAEETRAEGGVARAEAAFREASTRLANVLRIDGRVTLYAPDPSVEPLDLVAGARSLDSLIQEALQSRPELSEATLLAEAADREEQAASTAPFFPKLVVGTTFSAFGRNFDRFRDREEYAFALQWNFSLARFDERHRARAAATAARVEAARRREAIVNAVIRNYGRLHASKAVIESARRHVLASKEALRLVTKQRRNGTAMLFEVLEQQRDLALARHELLRAVLAQNRAERRLFFAIGR